jgi:undecaprenyl diphosphate synthase
MTSDIEAQIAALKSTRNLPRHVAIIMDGNGRWAKKRRLPRLAGHRAGREPVRMAVRTCAKLGIDYLTLYTFSLENWNRPSSEVGGLMLFLEDVLDKETLELDENNVRLNVIGRTELLPESTRGAIARSIDRLSKNDGLVLTLALSYGGRREILDAVRRYATDVANGSAVADDLDESTFQKYLYDPSLPDPDLLIRTSGEQRVSNFLLWQIAYTEIHVTDTLWPDFSEEDLLAGIRDYLGRERRYGLTD